VIEMLRHTGRGGGLACRLHVAGQWVARSPAPWAESFGSTDGVARKKVTFPKRQASGKYREPDLEPYLIPTPF